jgi:hypothetical protein
MRRAQDERFAINVTPPLATNGDFAVLLLITIESTGIPFPGKTMLLIAAIAAGTTHQLSIPLVIVAAASRAILGDNLGFWIGHKGGYYLVRRYGRFVRLDERKFKRGQYLFRYRMVRKSSSLDALSRSYAPERLSWLEPIRCGGPAFCCSMRLRGIVWASLVGLGGYWDHDAGTMILHEKWLTTVFTGREHER